ncbi:hypothetical protein OpiT1DRAFT_03831 [Opitutaceae bacterium TAV1]|nr:hypothetical protein OpiT1DRAFT_03831 [Opitutaceae bacterium TAV1]
MPRVPLEYYQPQRTPESTVRASPGMFDAEHAALARVGGAVQQAGDVVGDFALKMQKADNDAFLSTTRRRLGEAFDAFSNTWQSPGAKPETWEKDWAKIFDKTLGDLEREGGGKLFREQFDTLVADMRQRTSADVRKASYGRRIENDYNSHVATMERDKKSGNRAGYDAEIAMMEANGLVTAAKASEFRLKADHDFSEERAFQMINTDPFGAYELFSDNGAAQAAFPGLSEHELRTLTDNARYSRNVKKQEGLAELSDRFAEGNPPSNTELEAIGKKLGLTKKQMGKVSREAYAEALKTPSGQRTVARDALSKILRWDPQSPDQEQALEIQEAMMGLTGPMAKYVGKVWDDQSNPDSLMNNPAVKQVFRENEDNFEKHVYGNWMEFEEEPYTKKVGGKTVTLKRPKLVGGRPVMKVNSAKLAIAQAAKAKNFDRLRAYIAALPPGANPTMEEVRKVIYDVNDNDRVRTLFVPAATAGEFEEGDSKRAGSDYDIFK